MAGQTSNIKVQAWVSVMLILGLYRDNGEENGNYYSILGLYRGNGEENGNYCSILGVYRGDGEENGN